MGLSIIEDRRPGTPNEIPEEFRLELSPAQFRGAACSLTATVTGPARLLVQGEQAEFITEHYWG